MSAPSLDRSVVLACVGMINDRHWPKAPESWRLTIWGLLEAASPAFAAELAHLKPKGVARG